jgi:hypothetical protein
MIDFTNKDFKFIGKKPPIDNPEDTYWVPDSVVICESDYTDWKPEIQIKNGWGFFRGLTMVSYRGYKGELPREDGDTSTFYEFDIYYKDILINEITIRDLELIIIAEDREEKINSIM